jgi:hypothetical protein
MRNDPPSTRIVPPAIRGEGEAYVRAFDEMLKSTGAEAHDLIRVPPFQARPDVGKLRPRELARPDVRIIVDGRRKTETTAGYPEFLRIVDGSAVHDNETILQ